jgi:cyclohexadieny/prephenate dehydrogenase
MGRATRSYLNRPRLLRRLYCTNLCELQRAISWGEADTLQELFTRSRTIRRSIIEAKQAW